LDDTLILSGTSDTAHVRWAVISPDIVQVTLSYDNGAPTNIKEQFQDQGEHYYGIWGYASTATGVNLDARGVKMAQRNGAIFFPMTGSDTGGIAAARQTRRPLRDGLGLVRTRR
jgi:hypothetical protein